MKPKRSPLHTLLEHGQSYWLDNLTRDKLRSGELARRVSQEGLRGVTSNPAIFQKAIADSEVYDADIERMARDGLGPYAIYEGLVVDDIRDACDVLRPVYRASGGVDGFVSLELSPHLAHDTEGSMRDARRLFESVDRANLLIKIPGTEAGIPAIEQMIYEGVNVNVTLLFSVGRYEEVALAYVRGLERRLDEGRPVHDVSSVASFFLSRIDVLVDRLVGLRMPAHAAGDDGSRARDLTGGAAIANAKLAYQSLHRGLTSDRWRRLEREGARPQRLLWASTSTKDPLYSDVRYVEPLIGPHTVSTLTEDTIAAFQDHGVVATTIESGLEGARDCLEALEKTGVDLDSATRRLLDEGVEKFIRPFDDLIRSLGEARSRIVPSARPLEASGARARRVTDEVLRALSTRRFARRLFAHDASLWTTDAEEAVEIGDRLGWLEAPSAFESRIEELQDFADEIRSEGVRDVVVVGMGGSSLAADVSRRVFGPQAGYPVLHVIDDTAPTAIRSVWDTMNPEATLFVVASKSGTTVETLSLYHTFYSWVSDDERVDEPGAHFAAITDAGSPLAQEARDRGFRRVFANPSTYGGRYSALSYFGLVPMALQGVDLARLLAEAAQMRVSCGPDIPENANPGIELGAALGGLHGHGRDKVVLTFTDRLRPLGDWVEQLLAESTGKESKGLVPIVGEPLGPPDAYGDDRVFVHLAGSGEEDVVESRALEELSAAGQPVVRLCLPDIGGLGAEFFRWEIATAAAAAVLGVNPFDQPNVESAKRRTRDILELEDPWSGSTALVASDARIGIFEPAAEAGPRGASREDGAPRGESHMSAHEEDHAVKDAPGAVLASWLRGARAGDYLAILAYMARTSGRLVRLEQLRALLGDRLGVATTLGFGPRYLHSTGQLHKGGSGSGIFLVVTTEHEPAADVSIPGQAHGFAALHAAQAAGDMAALQEAGRRVVRVHLSGDVEDALDHLAYQLGITSGAPVTA